MPEEPDGPPVLLLRCALRNQGCGDVELDTITLLHGHARAVAPMSVTSGESLAMSGRAVSARRRATVPCSRAGSAQ